MIRSKMLWLAMLGCLAAVLVLVLLRRSGGGGGAASWLLLLVPAACVLGHCLPGLFGAKHGCHAGHAETQAPAERDGGPK